MARNAEQAGSTVGSDLVVLVVEDNDRIRKAEVDVLSGAGRVVLAAATADEALQILGHSRVDLLIADLCLPGGLSGIALARRVKQFRPDVRVMIVSADGDQLSSEDCHGIADDLLSKPFKFGELEERVASLVRSRSQAGELPVIAVGGEAADPADRTETDESGRRRT